MQDTVRQSRVKRGKQRMKVGDLVRRYSCTRLGIVVDTTGHVDNGLKYVKVQWDGEYGTFWTSTKAVEVLSESG